MSDNPATKCHEWNDMPLFFSSSAIFVQWFAVSYLGSVRDLGSIFHKAGEFYFRCGFAPFHIDAPADLVSWPVPPLRAKTTAAAAALLKKPGYLLYICRY